jgi:hypothetical protein
MYDVFNDYSGSIHFIRISEEYQSTGLQSILLSDTIIFTVIYAAAARINGNPWRIGFCRGA